METWSKMWPIAVETCNSSSRLSRRLARFLIKLITQISLSVQFGAQQIFPRKVVRENATDFLSHGGRVRLIVRIERERERELRDSRIHNWIHGYFPPLLFPSVAAFSLGNVECSTDVRSHPFCAPPSQESVSSRGWNAQVKPLKQFSRGRRPIQLKEHSRLINLQIGLKRGGHAFVTISP